MSIFLDSAATNFLQKRDICLIGFMGAGKSFVGEELALLLDRPLIDTDKLIESKAQMPIVTIFKTMGERQFRQIEKEVLQDIIYGNDACGRVICTGGGLPTFAANRKLLKQLNSLIIWLNPPFETIYERIKGTQRPLVYRRSRKSIFSLWARRYPEYQKIAHITISETNIEEVFDVLNKRVNML